MHENYLASYILKVIDPTLFISQYNTHIYAHNKQKHRY